MACPPVPERGDPLLIVAPSLGAVEIEDKRHYAERRLLGTPYTQDIMIRITEPIVVDELQGDESIADASDAKSGTPMTLYQVIVFDEAGYILVQGMVGAEFQEQYLPEFKAVARSLRRSNR